MDTLYYLGHHITYYCSTQHNILCFLKYLGKPKKGDANKNVNINIIKM